MNEIEENSTSPTPVIETAPPEFKNLFAPQRLEGESFDEYKMRRHFAKQKLKEMARGQVFWKSKHEKTTKGSTYRKEEVVE